MFNTLIAVSNNIKHASVHLAILWAPEEREQMFALKRAFDPNEGLNPGKVIPTLQRCAEYGKLTVLRGLLPSPICRGSDESKQ